MQELMCVCFINEWVYSVVSFFMFLIINIENDTSLTISLGYQVSVHVYVYKSMQFRRTKSAFCRK